MPIRPNLSQWLEPYQDMRGPLCPTNLRVRLETDRKNAGLARVAEQRSAPFFRELPFAAVPECRADRTGDGARPGRDHVQALQPTGSPRRRREVLEDCAPYSIRAHPEGGRMSRKRKAKRRLEQSRERGPLKRQIQTCQEQRLPCSRQSGTRHPTVSRTR